LPIQVWYDGEREYDESFAALLVDNGVEFVEARSVNARSPYSQEVTQSYAIKSLALINCPYKEVLWLDSDVYPDGNPDLLFDSPEFKESRAIFFPDIRKVRSDISYWDAFGLDYEKYKGEWEWESGVIYLDKEVHWKPLLLAGWFCNHANFYMNNNISLGDKDLFAAAWRLLGASKWSPTACHAIPMCLIQLGTKGEWLFYHRIFQKFDTSRHVEIEGFANESLLHQFLGELKLKWSPVLRGLGLTNEDKENTEKLNGSKFVYHRLGLDKRDMELGAGGSISVGAGGAEAYFYLREGLLHLASDNGDICVLEPCSVGWVGRWISHEKCVIVLEAVVL
jgi:hypothetical protein